MNTTLAPAPEQAQGAAETTIDLTGVTAYTAGIVRLAEAKGLRPAWGQPHGGTRRITLDAVGPHGAFGSIVIGRTGGKILRAEVIHGNDAKVPRRAKGTNAVRALLTDVTLSTCRHGCTAQSSTACRPCPPPPSAPARPRTSWARAVGTSRAQHVPRAAPGRVRCAACAACRQPPQGALTNHGPHRPDPAGHGAPTKESTS